MSEKDRSGLVQLIAVTIDQHAKGDLTELAEHLADRLEADDRVVRPRDRDRPARPGRPHVWPQFSGVTAGESRCLACGAAFRGRRAEDPCDPKI